MCLFHLEHQVCAVLKTIKKGFVFVRGAEVAAEGEDGIIILQR